MSTKCIQNAHISGFDNARWKGLTMPHGGKSISTYTKIIEAKVTRSLLNIALS